MEAVPIRDLPQRQKSLGYMDRIVCHPDNVPLLRKAIEVREKRSYYMGNSLASFMGDPWCSLKITPNEALDRDKPTGRIVTPDGKVHERQGFQMPWRRFATIEESDLPWALAFGIVTEEREPVFYLMSGFSLFRPWHDFGLIDRRVMLVRSTV